MKKLTFSVLILCFLAANAAVQDTVLYHVRFNPDSHLSDQRDGELVSTKILFSTPVKDSDEWEISIPKLATFEKGNKGVYPHVWELLETDDKLDVLFVGDSTISWGFDYHQFELNSGLKAASLSFGMNTPDIFLARMTSLLTRCAMNPKGLVILSYSYYLSMGFRGNRSVDQYLRSFNRDDLSCDDYRRELARRDHAPGAGPADDSKKGGWASILSNRAQYDRRVIDPLETYIDRLIPIKSASIGLADIFAEHLNKDAVAEEQIDFLRWDPAFRVPIKKRSSKWRYRPFDKNAAKQKWDKWIEKAKPRQLNTAKTHLSHWNRSHLSVPVCTAIPLSVRNEDVRYWQWKELGTSECLINYGEVLKKVGKIDQLDMQMGTHLPNDSGLIMAAVLGRYFKINGKLIEQIHNGRPVGDGIVFVRGQ